MRITLPVTTHNGGPVGRNPLSLSLSSSLSHFTSISYISIVSLFLIISLLYTSILSSLPQLLPFSYFSSLSPKFLYITPLSLSLVFFLLFSSLPSTLTILFYALCIYRSAHYRNMDTQEMQSLSLSLPSLHPQ